MRKLTKSVLEDPVLSITEVLKRIPLGRSTIYTLIKKGQFPKPIRLTSSRVVWLESDIQAYIQQRITERNNRLKEVV